MGLPICHLLSQSDRCLAPLHLPLMTVHQAASMRNLPVMPAFICPQDLGKAWNSNAIAETPVTLVFLKSLPPEPLLHV